MAQHYYDKTGTHYLEQKRLGATLSPFSEFHLNFINRFLESYPFQTKEEKKETLKRFSTFASGIKKYFKVKDNFSHLELLLFDLGAASEEQIFEYKNRHGFHYQKKVVNAGGADISQGRYDEYSNMRNGVFSELKFLTLKPSIQLGDASKSTKINWSEHKKQAAFFKFAFDFIADFNQLAQPASYQETFTLSLVPFKNSYHTTQNKSSSSNEVKTTQLQISIQAVLKQLNNFWQNVEKKVVPVMEKTYALQENDYVYKEFQGSLDNPTDLLSSTAYYFMGRYNGKDGFIGLEPASTSYYGGGVYSYKIVKEIKNAHLFTSDKSAELTHFQPLTKIHMKVNLSHIENAATPAAAQVAAYIEKNKLSEALPKPIKPQNVDINHTNSVKRHKI